MAASVVPALLDALFTTATTALPSAVVIDGVGVTGDPGNYLMVGVNDPDISPHETEAAAVTQTQTGFGTTGPRLEAGVVHMVARAIDGRGSAKSARDAVYALQEALATALRPVDMYASIGVVSISNGANLQLMQGQDNAGAIATLLYDIAFQAEI